MNLFFIFAISQVGEGSASIRRIQVQVLSRKIFLWLDIDDIQEFLMLQEKDQQDNVVKIQKLDANLDQSCPTINMENITIS